MRIKRTTIAMSASLLLLAIASQATAANMSTNGQASIEFMCKAKAKEIAAETYKGCVTENKQAQVERIRKEYQTKLAELKNQYNGELKQLSPKKAGKAAQAAESNTTSEMPAKKMKTSKVKTEKIDFSAASSPVSTIESAPSENSYDSAVDVAVPETEIVEIPVQQE